MIQIVAWIWLWLSIGVTAWVVALLFIWALCVAAARGDRINQRRFRDESM